MKKISSFKQMMIIPIEIIWAVFFWGLIYKVSYIDLYITANFLFPLLGIVHGIVTWLCFKKILVPHLVYLCASSFVFGVSLKIRSEGAWLELSFYEAFIAAFLFSVIPLVLSLISAFITKCIVKNGQNNTTPQ